jgi:hypothetical protein
MMMTTANKKTTTITLISMALDIDDDDADDPFQCHWTPPHHSPEPVALWFGRWFGRPFVRSFVGALCTALHSNWQKALAVAMLAGSVVLLVSTQ